VPGIAIANNPPTLAPGYSPLAFTPPKPGSYLLPPLGLAANGQIVNSENKDLQLHDLMGDKIVLLSFIYSTCSDINGCPLATAVFHKIKKRLKKEPLLANKLRLLTLSFDPHHDTPKAMKHYAEGLQDAALDWQFLTTRSETELQPILQHYQQNIQKVSNAAGQFTGTFSHILRVYLIDKNKQLRNIYSVSFLHADTLISDIKTLLIPQTTQTTPPKTLKKNHLINTILQPPLGLPKVPIPNENPITAAKINLGKKLFFDRRLSANNTFSCAMCHIPEQGFGSNEMATAVGVEGRTVRRNSPTLYNVAYYQSLFHDGRESTLENQVWGPLLADNEMANPSIGYVIDKIKQLPDYQTLFKRAFKRPIGMETISFALASYERSLNSADSNFDRWHFGQQENAISPSAQQGYRLFTGKAKCSHCHTLAANHALFTDHQFHNTGIGYKQTMSTTTKTTKVQLAPGLFIQVENQLIDAVSEHKTSDLGRYEITHNPADRWKYKTPSLRNISLTAPYMHNGSLNTLEQVVHFYNQGGINNALLDPIIEPLHLTEQEISNLLEFLKTLTGNNNHELH
jgi:cytochrome c peroxidase